MILSELLKRDFVFSDGAIGTMLQKMGLKAGERPDIMNITNPDAVYAVQAQYAQAGSNILITNTFGANAIVLEKTGYSVEDIISAAIAVTKRAGAGETVTALDIGPIGEFLAPYGVLTAVDAYGLFRTQAVAGERSGVDMAVIETMGDLLEMKTAILAVTENAKLPVFSTMTFNKDAMTYAGCSAESFALTATKLGVTALGLNCSLGPADVFDAAEKIAGMSALPLIVKPNAGLPNSETGEYDLCADDFAEQMADFAKIGAKILGGCCGTNPEYISALKKRFAGMQSAKSEKADGRFICSRNKVLRIDSADFNEDSVTVVELENGMSPEEAVSEIANAQMYSVQPLHIVSAANETLVAALHAVSGIAAVSLTSHADEQTHFKLCGLGAEII